MQPVKSYRIQYNGEVDIPAEQICHIKDFNPFYDGTGSHLYGQSPLRAGLRSMTTNNEAVQTGVKYLQNQTARGVLMSEEGDINEVQAQQLKDKFRSAHQGSNNAGDIIITPKKLSWVNFGLNASDVSLIEQYNASIKDLCNIYHVPVQMLNNTDASTYNNMKEAKKALYQNAVIPELCKIRDELNRWLAPQFGEKLCIDFDFSVIPELQEETEKVVNQMSQAWWLTPNEKRMAMNYGEDQESDILNDYYIPANLIPVKDNDVSDIEVDNEIDVAKLLKKKEEPKEIVIKETYGDYPQSATNNAKRVKNWIEKHGREEVRGMTEVGLARMNQLIAREKLSLSTLKRTFSFLSRTKGGGYDKINPDYRDTPWRDKGYVAFLGWGGNAMLKYAERKLNQLENDKE
jgi:hypothetical protein